MNITNNTFSIRDYLAYVFPGLFLLGLVPIMRPELWIVLKDDKAVFAVLVLIVSYILGFASRTISFFLFVTPANKIFRNPYSGFLRGKQDRLDEPFRLALQARLNDIWGEEIGTGKEVAILYLCYRDIQGHEHKGIDYLYREITLSNLSASLLLPAALYIIVFFYQQNYALGIVSLLVFLSMYRARYNYRVGFAKNVYRIWYVLYRKEGEK